MVVAVGWFFEALGLVLAIGMVFEALGLVFEACPSPSAWSSP